MVKEVELKSGLEIHQQLDTHKLFCNCPSILRQDTPDYEVERQLHVVAGETGDIDIAAKKEAEKDKTYIYQGYKDNTCLVELDEEPPHSINQEALKIAIQLSLLLNCEILPYTQIMRKTVIDGSNTGGFQRTLLIGKNGYLKTPQGKVGIWYVYLEEDAARKIKEEKNKITYKLDRLGIPLVEIVTAPDIKTPEQARETALLIGEILRVCKVKRGLGTIRQDINISIPGHPRAEIKGFQDPKIFVDVVKKEEERQKRDLKSGKKLYPEVRGALKTGSTKFLRPLPGSARMYPETDHPMLHISKNIINEAKSSLPKLKSEIRTELKQGGLSEEMTKLLLKENKLEEFKELLPIYNNPDLIVKLLILWQKELKQKIKNAKKITLDLLETILQAIQDKKILENEAKSILEKIMKGVDIIQALKVEKIENIEEEILKLIKSKPGLSEKAYMGLIMKEFKGKVNPKEVMDILKKLLK